MSTPPAGSTPPPAGTTPGAGIAVRPLAVWALLALAAVIIAFGVLAMVFPAYAGFSNRFRLGAFTQLAVLISPLLAVLLATKVAPVLPQAKLISMIAVAEYAAALLFGVLAFLFSIADNFTGLGSGIYAFGGLIQGFGDILENLLRLSLLALAGLYVYQTFNRLGGKLPAVNIKTD